MTTEPREIAYEGLQPPLVAAIARSDGLVVGAGFLVSADILVTCGHVVRDASEQGEDTVTVSMVGEENSKPIKAKILKILGSEPTEQSKDVALLQLSGALSGYRYEATPLEDLANSNLDQLKLQIFGFPDESRVTPVPKVVGDNIKDIIAIGYDARGLVQLSAGGKLIERGFSGAAVRNGRTIVGMLVTNRGGGREAFMIPASLLVKRLEEASPGLIVELQSAAAREFPHVGRLQDFVREEFNRVGSLGSRAARRDLFSTEAAFCESFDEIERVHRSQTAGLHGMTPSGMLEAARNRTVYLQAPGGYGKTFYLLRMLLAGIDAGFIPFYLDARRAESKQQPDDAGLSKLFGECTQAGGSWSVFLDAFKKKIPLLVAIDGLNESIHSATGVIRRLDYLARNYAPLTLIIADRMSNAERHLPQFKRATMLPLSEGATESQVPDVIRTASSNLRKLLSIPFFLDLYREIAERSPSQVMARQGRLDIMFAYLSLCESGDAERDNPVDRGKELASQLGPIAFEAYRRGDVRIERNWLEKQLGTTGSELIRRFEDAGLFIAAGNDRISFRHQLFHDFLAGYQLANLEPTKWTSSIFDTVTLRAKSFDALEFTVELLGDRANNFLIEIYDWNYNAAINCVLDLEAGIAGKKSPVSPALRDALFALNAEKRFDAFENTRVKAERRAKAIRAPSNIDHMGASSRQMLVETVKNAYAEDPAFPMGAEWKRLFTLGGKPQPGDWVFLQHSPLLAWTAANVFRCSISSTDPLVDYLIRLYDMLLVTQHGDEKAIATRWRIVHLLGAVDRDDVIAILMRATTGEDPDRAKWVRYGAVRSLVEIASRRRNVNAANEILKRVIEAMDQLVGSPAFNELRDVAIIACASPSWWAEAYAPVLRKGIELGHSKQLEPQEIKLWEDRLRDLTRIVGSSTLET